MFSCFALLMILGEQRGRVIRKLVFGGTSLAVLHVLRKVQAGPHRSGERMTWWATWATMQLQVVPSQSGKSSSSGGVVPRGRGGWSIVQQQTIVSIYEVDEEGTTGPWIGQGTLVLPQLVLVHPPLSAQIANGKTVQQSRVGICAPTTEAFLGARATAKTVEIIDVIGQPRVFWTEEASGQVLVGLDLRTPARSPVDKLPNIDSETPAEQGFKKSALHLQRISSDEREINPSVSADLPSLKDHPPIIREKRDGSGPVAGTGDPDNWWCRMIPMARGCD